MRTALLAALLALLAYLLWRSLQPGSVGALSFAASPGQDTSDASDPIGQLWDSISNGVSDVADAVTGRSVDAVVSVWADAIQQHEGFTPGSRSFRNNNPGNLRGKGDAGSDAQGFRIYSSYAAGRAALEADLKAKIRKYPGYSITQIMARYAPASDGNNVNAYAAVVASALGVSTETTLADLVG